MSVFEKMVSTQAQMFLYLLVGAIISKTGVLKKEGRSSFLQLLVKVTIPCMILHSFEMEIEGDAVMTALLATAAGIGCSLIGLALGSLFFGRKEPGRRKALVFSSMVNNMGNAGLPIVSMVFGSIGVFITSFGLISNIFFMWSIGLMMYAQCEKNKMAKTILTNPNMIAIMLGVVLFTTGLKLPSPVSSALDRIGAMTAPLSMMMIGATLADMRPRDALDRDAFALSAVRLLILPVLFMVIMRLIGLPDVIWQVITVLFAMPAPTNVAIIAEMYQGDYKFATKVVFVSTVLSLVTVPCITLVF